MRKKLFERHVSMQEFFDRVVEEIVKDSRFSVTTIIDKIVVEKTKIAMEKSKFKERKRIEHQLSDLDVNTLYNLIGDRSEDEKIQRDP